MEILDRIRQVVKWIIGNGYASNQKEVGMLLGYSNESSFSQILNGKKPLPAGFVDKITEIDNRIDKGWINTGTGTMIKTMQNDSYTVSEPNALYLKREEANLLSTFEIIDRNNKNIEKMIEIADRNSRSIEKIAESNNKLIELLCNKGIVIPNKKDNSSDNSTEN